MKVSTLTMVLFVGVLHAVGQPGWSEEPKLFTPISLAPIANRKKMEHLVRPPAGRVTFEGVPFQFPTPHQRFETNGVANHDPISGGILASVPRPLAVHILLTGGYVPPDHKGKEVGRIILDFEDGSEVDVPIKAWVTIRESWSGNEEIIPPSVDQNVKLINVLSEDQFRGKQSTAFLDQLVINLGRDKVSTRLVGITIRDTSRKFTNKSGLYAGAPSLVVDGITVEHEAVPESPLMPIIYKSLKITNPRIIGGPYSPGDTVTFAYELTNSSKIALDVPVDESLPQPLNHVGIRQHLVERQGDDPMIPNLVPLVPQEGANKNKYGAGGTIIPTKARIAAGESLPFQQRLATKGFSAGKYTFHIEYRKVRGDTLQTEKVDFELTDK